MEKEQQRQEIKVRFEERRSVAMVRSLRNAVVKTAVQPIVSLKSVRINKESGRNLIAFAIKVAALEIIRRHTHTRCPPIWACIQSLPLLQLPPFSFLQRFRLLNYLLIGSQVFSKPIMALSLATTITDKYNELRTVDEPNSRITETFNDEVSVSESDAIGPLALVPGNIQREQGSLQASECSSDSLILVKQELNKLGVALPERIGDEELERFLGAANNNVKRCAALVKRNIRWRETFYFFPQYELEKWASLVFWHGYDIQMRPSLVVRIGWAYSVLKANERPRFAQAILSQVEYGVTHLLQDDDPRITVIIDCEGTPALGFPVNMLKSCCVRVQENYPTRLAALFVVNLPPVVRVIAQTIIQVLKPATKRKIFVEGDRYDTLAEHCGGPDSMPFFLGGNCSCCNCNKVSVANHSRRAHLRLLENERASDDEDDDGSDVDDDLSEITTFSRYNSILRAIIVGFLILWVVVSLLAGFFDPEADYIPT